MSKISFFKKVKLFSVYRKIIKNNKFELEQRYSIRIDRANRLYTVLNVPEQYIGDAYSLVKSDINKISENYIREYGSALSIYLNSIGLTELFETYEIKKVAKYSYLIVIGFSLFNTKKFYNNLYKAISLFFILIAIGSYFILRY